MEATSLWSPFITISMVPQVQGMSLGVNKENIPGTYKSHPSKAPGTVTKVNWEARHNDTLGYSMHTPHTDDMVVCPRGWSKLALSWGVQWAISSCPGGGGKLHRPRGTLNSIQGGLDCSQAVLRGSRNLVIRRGCTLTKWNTPLWPQI